MCASAAEGEMERLRQRLKEMEEQLNQAAQAGLDCLNNQVELQNQLEENRTEMTNEIDALRQDKYSLEKEVELKSRMLESLQSEYDAAMNQTKQLHQQREDLQSSHSVVLSELNEKILSLESLLEESQHGEKQLRHKFRVQTETLNSKTEELRALREQTQSSTSGELMELQVEITALENTKVELERLLQESQSREEQSELTSRRLQRHLQQIKQDKEDRETEVVSLSNQLERLREKNQDLQAQLDLVQQQQQPQDPNSKGNSLFAEVEDKRAAMERQLISMKVQYQSLQKHHSFSKQQLQRMKAQIATLMQLQGSRADPAQLERLQSMLSEKNSEIQNLMTKLRRLEKEEMVMKSQPSNPGTADGCDGYDETYYTDLLKMKLNNAIKDAERLGEELSLQRMKALSESQRALDLERKLFTSERLLKQAQSDKIRLQLRVEELQHKYEPKDAKKNLIQKGRREKLPVDIIPPSEEAAANKAEAVAEIDDTNKTASSEADAQRTGEAANSTEGPQPEKRVKISDDLPVGPQPEKRVKISDDLPTVIPKPSSPASDCQVEEMDENQGRNRREVGRRRQAVEVIHVSSTRTMENECAQQ